ncbi:FtsX-like permease family protein [uncultured Parabacteroides sp.]|uniref:ABC transporter permease n=1 Tax=uncultured Parabacteroides sp. TaxID=512312 RepID=UPI002628E0E4|nr:FtsX-like permease family protein [uncultured Parabacteroides sp.]
MYKMILKQLWNERKGNLFIWLEMLVVSIFLWYAADALFVMYKLYSQSLGFNIEHTYHVSFGVIPEESPDYDTTSVHSERGGGDYLALVDRIRRYPSVESVCFTTGVHFHYRGSNQYATFRKDSLLRNGFVRFVSPTYFEVFDVKTAQGGSPSELVTALRDNQVVVTGTVADDFFGDPAAAVRQELYITDQGSRDSVAYRIGGVCEKQRYCEFSGYDYAYYKLVDEKNVAEESDWVGEGLNTFIRVKPGVDAAAFTANFRKEMEPRLRMGNIYLKDIFPMSHYRDQFLERWIDQVRLYVAGIAFFLLNVLLGVVGTFWYRTQQRSAEIGLRMAMGATRKGTFWQLVKEGLALLTIAFIPSAIIFANMLYMEVTQGSMIPPDIVSRLLFGFVFSYAVMAAMIVFGILFPARKAARMVPVEALRCE